MIRALALAAALVATPAFAADITVTLNDQQQQIVLQALDAYVKTGGINTAGNAVSILQTMQAAAKTKAEPQGVPQLSK